MTVRHRHKDQADDVEQITLWEYLRRAAEKSSCQEGLAAEQRSPFWGTRLAAPLPGSGLLRYASASASSVCRRQHWRRRAPVPDSVAGRSDAPAPSSTGGLTTPQLRVLELDHLHCLALLRKSTLRSHPRPRWL
ncbi:hypothetical protein AMECASPLE_032114 [Ameca splendens]|uniref:Uncharacterized protein n=1 Tax=Ameca splendens TaxID=208324 RepID=A0ABV0YHL5_9TELE